MDSSSHTNNVVLEQQQQQLINNEANLGVPTTEQAKLTPEQEEEIKLRIKYPNPQKPGGSAFIQKMLHRGSKKYFDSGDYNMAKSKIKSLNNNQINNVNNTTANTTTTTTITTTTTNTNNLCYNTNQTCNNQVILENANVQLSQSPVVNELNSPSIVLEATTPSIKEPNRSLLHTPTTTISSTNSSPSIPNSASVNQIPNCSNLNVNYQAAPQSLSSSISASSIHMLSSSISTDKLSNIHINTSNPTSMLDSEEIGHGIPTPECLPQSRKHSIVQSKLATPRLSTS